MRRGEADPRSRGAHGAFGSRNPGALQAGAIAAMPASRAGCQRWMAELDARWGSRGSWRVSSFRLLGISADLGGVHVDGREVHLGVFPRGIDAQAFSSMAADASMDAEVQALRGGADAKDAENPRGTAAHARRRGPAASALRAMPQRPGGRPRRAPARRRLDVGVRRSGVDPTSRGCGMRARGRRPLACSGRDRASQRRPGGR